MASAHPVRFGVLLRRLRSAAGLTQEGLAATSGVAPRTISDIGRGLVDRPRAYTVDLLADALKLSTEAKAVFLAAASPGLAHTSFPSRSHCFSARSTNSANRACAGATGD